MVGVLRVNETRNWEILPVDSERLKAIPSYAYFVVRIRFRRIFGEINTLLTTTKTSVTFSNVNG